MSGHSTLVQTLPEPDMDAKIVLKAGPAAELPSPVVAAQQSVPLNLLPHSLEPFGETVRLHRPAGVYAFFYPCVYGILLASIVRQETPSVIEVLRMSASFLVVSFLVRCLVVTWNDWHEYDFDGEVARTPFRPIAKGALTAQDGYGMMWAFRPLARGALSKRDAFGLMAVLMWATWTAFHALLPEVSWQYILPVAAMHFFYPYAMRMMHHPEVVLALALAGGSVLAFPAFGIELNGIQDILNGKISQLTQPEGRATLAVVLVFGAVLAWTLLCDTIYVAQDVEDEQTAGVRLTLLQHNRLSRWFLRALAATQVSFLVGLGYLLRTDLAYKGALFFALTCGLSALSLIVMIEKVDVRRPESAAWWLSRGNELVAASMVSGVMADYAIKVL